jgi:hypothetical protein
MSTYVTVLKIQLYLKLAHMYLYWIHKNLYLRYIPLCSKYLFGYVMSTYVTVLKIQCYLKLAHMYLYWIHKNLYRGYKNLSVAAMKKKLYFAICIKQFRDVQRTSSTHTVSST